MMTLYFFDTRDDDKFSQDDLGVSFPNLEAAKLEAARSLAELARNVIPGRLRRVLIIEVRDALGPVLKAMMQFDAVVFRQD